MSCRNHRRWHFREPQLKKISVGACPRLWGALGALTFLPLRVPWKSHAADYRYLIVYEINQRINAQGRKKRLVLEGVGINDRSLTIRNCSLKLGQLSFWPSATWSLVRFKWSYRRWINYFQEGALTEKRGNWNAHTLKDLDKTFHERNNLAGWVSCEREFWRASWATQLLQDRRARPMLQRSMVRA